ncbi:MAG: hypothetical protein ACXVRZ_14580 [Gaiellaceae bacterium]
MRLDAGVAVKKLVSGAAVFVALTALTTGAALGRPVGTAATCNGAISWTRSATLVGRVATIVGPVASTKYASSSSGSPTFLDIGRPYPNEGLTVVIWIENRASFGRPEAKYARRTICVHGLVGSHAGVPEIIARSPNQIAIRP